MATFDQRTALPASVTVVFPRQDEGAPSGDPTAYTVTLASLGLATVPAPPPTFTGTKVLWSSAVAYWEAGEVAATNDTELQTLAERMASDWYSWRLAPYDLTYQGWVPWACDGAHDVILDHTTERQQTRVMRGPWLEHVEHSLHSGTYGSSPPGGSNNHYNTTINYGGNTTINYGPNTTNHFYGPVYYPHYTYNQFTTNITNWNLTAGNVRVRVSTDEHFREIRSIVPGAAPAGRVVCIHNVGDYVILIPHNSGAGANSILTTTGNYYWLASGHEVTLVYDATSTRWRVSESSDERLGGVADYGSLTSNQDDLQLPIECLHHLFAPTANRNITGLANGKAGLRFYLVNQSDTYSITLKHDVTSTLGMRFLLPGGVDYEIQPEGAALVVYDGDVDRWRLVGGCCDTGGGGTDQDLFSTIAVDGQDPIIADDPSDTLTIVAGTGVELLTDAATDTLTINITSAGDPPAYVPRWVKVTKTFTDFSTAATTNEIVLYTLPAGAMLHAAAVKHTASFTGGGVYAYSVSAGLPGGVPGDDTNALTTFDVFQAPGGGTFHYVDGTDSIPPFPLFMSSFGSTFDLKAYAACAGGDLDDATTGSVDFYLLISELAGAPDEFGGGGGPLAHNAFATVQTPGGADSATAGSPASVITFEGDSVIGVGIVQDGDGATVTLSYIPPAFAGDASDVTYTPLTSGDWDSPGDPGNVDDALDELASRVEGIEGLSYVENLNDLGDVVITTPSTGQLLRHNGTNWVNATVTAGGDFSGPASSVDGVAVVFDGTTGKLGKQATGTGVAKLASGVLSAGTVSFAEMQTVSTDILLGNDAAGTAVQEITCTAAGRALLDDADAAAQRTTLGLGTLATQSGTFAATPSGTVAMFAAASAPSGWLLCDGSAVSRSTYADLFTAIGTTWGVGDGSTTFNVPDMRGRAPIGVGTGSGLTSRSLAASGGAETHVLTEAEMPAHTHGPTSGAAEIWQRNFGGGLDVNIALGGGAQDGARAVTSVTGSSNAHANMQPWRALNFIIKT